MLALEVIGPTSGFVVGGSHVGDPISLATDTVTWLPYLSNAYNITTRRGGTNDSLLTSPEVGTLTASFVDRHGAAGMGNDLNIKPNVPVRLMLDGEPIFTGTGSDVVTSEAKNGDTYVTFVNVDSVASLANTKRYGAIAPGDSELWPARIRRLATSARVPFNLPDDPSPTFFGLQPSNWTVWGTKPANIVTYSPPIDRFDSPGYIGAMFWMLDRATTNTYSQPAYSFGPQTLLTGLTPGVKYHVEMKAKNQAPHANPGEDVPHIYALSVVGKGWGPLVDFDPNPDVPREWHTLEYDFTATSATHTLRLGCAQNIVNSRWPETIWWQPPQIGPHSEHVYYRLASTVHESSLKAHLDLACASVGAVWWPSVEGPIEFSDELPQESVLTFTDDGSGDVDYSDVVIAWDTKAVVNDLALTNRRMDLATRNAADVTVGYSDDVSSALWGQQSASIDVNLNTDGENLSHLNRRAAEMLTTMANPRRTPRSVTFRTNDARAARLALELYRLVTVRRRGEDFRCRVIGISDVFPSRPDKWRTTLTLREEQI